MTWTVGSPLEIATNDIIQQDGIFAYNFYASGNIKKGQAVYISADNKVSPCTSAAGECDAIGIACYDADDTAQISIAGPGNIAIAAADSALAVTTIGSPVYGDTDGEVTTTRGNAKKTAGYIIDNAATEASGSCTGTHRICEILLV